MRVRFWGVRGSIATPGKNTADYGGNTTCIEVEDDFGQTFIFDAGTGIRELGLDLARRKVGVIHLFITHTHWDHIQGFPFFVSAYIPGNKIHIHGPTHFEKTLKKIMDLQMDYAYFPISMQQLNAAIDYRDLKEETLQFGETTIQTQYSNHPVTGLCYKITCNGKSVVFTGDMEPYYNVLNDPETDEEMNQIVAERNERHRLFCKADLLIHDAQYTADEYPKFQGWGHSSMEHVIEIAKSHPVKKLILTHHDPSRTDVALAALEAQLKAVCSELDLCFSKEAMEIQV